jgi:hypothetical protein
MRRAYEGFLGETLITIELTAESEIGQCLERLAALASIVRRFVSLDRHPDFSVVVASNDEASVASRSGEPHDKA